MKNLLNWHRLWPKLIPKLIPKRLLSHGFGKIADSSNPWIKKQLCQWASNTYAIDLSEAVGADFDDYSCFNDFFDRALLPQARPIDRSPGTIICPADGVLSEHGRIIDGQLIQTKKHRFSSRELLQDHSLADYFEGGQFATIYLSPKDYHRVHLPIAAELTESRYIKGELYAVNQRSVNNVPNLFAVNERCVCVFETDTFQYAVVFVGAIFVNGIRVSWQTGRPSAQYIPQTPQHFQTGAEIGYFRFGSTVIVLFPEKPVQSIQMNKNAFVKIGQKLTRS